MTSSTEATRFIKGLASEAEAVKAKVSVAHMARGLGCNGGGSWCKDYLEDVMPVSKWLVTPIYKP